MIRASEFGNLAWRKSSFSASGGENCVEVASTLPVHWRKSSFSDSGGPNCVEVASTLPVDWRKSSFSDSGGENCLEVGEVTTTRSVALRDSRNPDGPALLLTAGQWRCLLQAARDASIEV